MTGARLPLLLLAVAAGGCVHHKPLLPRDQGRGTPAEASIEEVPACGYRVVVELKDRERVEGELIAADAAALHVLDASRLARLPAGSIDRIAVEVLPNHTAGITGGTVAGTLSTIGNGVFLVFTAPLWIVSGTVAGSSAASRSSERAAPADAALPAYARFPQGLPPGWPPAGAKPPACKLIPTDDPSSRIRKDSPRGS